MLSTLPFLMAVKSFVNIQIMMSPNTPLKNRFGCTLVFIIWILLLCLPMFGFMLALKGELRLNLGEFRQRVWLIQDSENNGVGWQSESPARASLLEATCQEIRVQYFFWQGGESNANAHYCTCEREGVDMPPQCP
ncbi:MAG TPA: hypothetical protein PK299_05700 [Anaerolineales bacterium]|nr:hypothetical protein [Anaerolineales bacterium]